MPHNQEPNSQPHLSVTDIDTPHTSKGTVDNFSISELKENSEWIELIATWHHREWMSHQRNNTPETLQTKLQDRIRLLQRHLNSEHLPNTFVGHIEGDAIATVSLVYYQFNDSAQPSEWLTNMYVEPEYRNQGLATRLLDHAIQYAQSIRLPRLLLYTSDCGPFYIRRQWRRVNSGLVQGQQVEIMEYKLQ
ncbi:MAG: GNAT family N-acetyltransferase [Agarilytica sp.]